jgi:hypothetical protein
MDGVTGIFNKSATITPNERLYGGIALLLLGFVVGRVLK